MSADPRNDPGAMAAAQEAMRKELDELKTQLAHAQQHGATHLPPPRPATALPPWARALIVLAILAPIGVMILGAVMAANLLRAPQVPPPAEMAPQR